MRVSTVTIELPNLFRHLSVEKHTYVFVISEAKTQFKKGKKYYQLMLSTQEKEASFASQINTETLEKAAFLLKTVAHPVRLSILKLLENEEKLSVNEICTALDVEQSLTSHHLSNMKLKGILTSERAGKNIYYSIKERNILGLFACLENCRCLL